MDINSIIIGNIKTLGVCLSSILPHLCRVAVIWIFRGRRGGVQEGWGDQGGGVTGDSGTRSGVQGEIMLVFAAGTWYFTREVMR